MSKEASDCVGCGESRILVKSHVIPESFFRDLKRGSDYLHLLSSDKGDYPKKSRIGVYDKTILCRACEGRFQKVDDYAAKLLLNEDNLSPMLMNGQAIGYQFKDVNFKLLKLFFISLLWRASISAQHFYRKVNLMELESTAKSMLWEEDIGGDEDFSFILAKFTDTGTISKAMLDPLAESFEGVKYYRFYLGGFVLYIKSDDKPTPSIWRNLTPSENRRLYVISRGNIEKSEEYPILKKNVEISGLFD